MPPHSTPNVHRPRRKARPALHVLVGTAFALLTTARLAAEGGPEWPQFRGPNGQGVADDARPPVVFGPQTNLAWRTAVGPGHSSPIVRGGQVFLTTAEGGRLALVAFDRTNGRPRWTWAVPAGPTNDVHVASSPAAPTPAADAARVYAYFGSWGLAAVAHDGREVWRRPLPPPRNRYGMATSPVLHGTNVILVLDADDGDSRMVAFDAADGRTVWETKRPGQRATWSTPALARADGGDELVVLSALRLSAYDPGTGAERWSIDGFPQETISVPAVGAGLVFASAAALGGRGTERYDAMGWKQLLAFDRNADGQIQLAEVPDDFRMILRPDLPPDHPGYTVPFPFKRDFKNRDFDHDGSLTEAEWNRSIGQWEAASHPVLMAVRPGNPRRAATDRVAWKTARGIPEMPSILFYRDRLFFVRDGGLLTCLAAADGQSLYQERVGAAGQYCASPVAADGRVYLTSVAGIVTVVDATTPVLRVLSRNDLGEEVHASPALAGSTLFIRGARSLFAFSAP